MFEDRQFEWPNGAYIAVTLSMAWETWPANLGTATSDQNTNRRPLPASARYPRDMWVVYEHSYAETTGLERLVDVFQRHEVNASVFTNGKTLELYPETAQQLEGFGFDIVAENWIHDYTPLMSAEEERESIKKTVDIFQSVLGRHPRGYISPGGKSTPVTYPILAELGFQWAGGVRNTSVPYIIPVGDTKLVGMDNYMIGDYESYSHTGWTPRQLIAMIRDEFDALYEEGKRGRPKMLAYGVHPFLARGFRTKPFEEFVEFVQETQHVWIATRSEIAEWVAAQYPDLTYDKLYPSIARARGNGTICLYESGCLTRR